MITDEVTSQVTILPVSISAIFDAPNAAHLIRAYAKACIVPDAAPQRYLYEAMDRAGIFHCFAAYVDEAVGEPDTPESAPHLRLVGFASVICSIMPHDGHLVATLGEMFVDPPYRSLGADGLLMSAMEEKAEALGARCFVCLARTGSAYDKVLSRRTGFTQTHSQYTKWLNGYKGGRS